MYGDGEIRVLPGGVEAKGLIGTKDVRNEDYAERERERGRGSPEDG